MKNLENPLTGTNISPVYLFWLCAGIYALAWTIVPDFAISNVPIDTLEGYAWGHEWQLGTYKHPPLTGWVLEALALLTNRASWAHFLANELAVITAFWAVWQTGRRIVDETAALVGALLLVVIPYYNILIPEFNPNVLQLPFWALTGWSFHRAIKNNKMLDWIALAIWGAAALYTKYSSALLLVSLAGLMLYHPEARKRFKSIGPWLTILLTTILLLPHILWLFKNNFMPFTYAADRFEHIPSKLAFFAVPALFIFWQASTLLPTAIVYVFSFGKPFLKKKSTLSFDKAFLYSITFGPALITSIISIVSGDVIRNMWATPFWNFIGLWAVFTFHPDLSAHNLRRFARLSSFIFIVGLAGFYSVEALGPYMTHKVKRVNFSGPLFAEAISKAWHDRYHTPLRYVVGDTWIGGNIAYYAPDRPRQLTDGNYKISPWISPEDINKHGGVIVWCGEHCDKNDTDKIPAYLKNLFLKAEIQPPLTFPEQTGADVPAAMVNWAILPPETPQKAP